MSEFTGRTAWITGAGSGIGRALAVEMARRGARLILSGRNHDALEEVARSLGGDPLQLPFEATDETRLPAVVQAAIAWSGGIDILVNNAGITQRSLAIDTQFSVYRKLMEVDFFAPVHLTRLLLPHMIERRSGHIAVVNSIAGKIGAPLRSGYSAAKHACVGYFDALRGEIETAYGIHVSTIFPGSTRTNIAAAAVSGDGSIRGRSDGNIDNGMAPETVASAIADGLAERRREIIVAEGVEAQALALRASDPERLFAFLADEGRRLAEAQADTPPGELPEPTNIQGTAFTI